MLSFKIELLNFKQVSFQVWTQCPFNVILDFKNKVATTLALG